MRLWIMGRKHESWSCSGGNAATLEESNSKTFSQSYYTQWTAGWGKLTGTECKLSITVIKPAQINHQGKWSSSQQTHQLMSHKLEVK